MACERKAEHVFMLTFSGKAVITFDSLASGGKSRLGRLEENLVNNKPREARQMMIIQRPVDTCVLLLLLLLTLKLRCEKRHVPLHFSQRITEPYNEKE